MGDLRYTTVHCQLSDVSSAEIVRVAITPGLAGELKQIRTVLGGTITVADAKLTIKKNTTAIGTITVSASGSAAGVQDYLDFNAISLVEGDRIVIDCDGGSTDAANLGISIDIKI